MRAEVAAEEVVVFAGAVEVGAEIFVEEKVEVKGEVSNVQPHPSRANWHVTGYVGSSSHRRNNYYTTTVEKITGKLERTTPIFPVVIALFVIPFTGRSNSCD